MKIKIFFIFFIISSFTVSFGAMYECRYKNLSGVYAVQTFNTLNTKTKNYQQLLNALKSGNCRELYVKKYFINGTSCNIQFYKSNKRIANLSCKGNDQAALNKLRAIARSEYGYMGY